MSFLKATMSDILPKGTCCHQNEKRLYDHSDFEVEKILGNYIAETIKELIKKYLLFYLLINNYMI